MSERIPGQEGQLNPYDIRVAEAVLDRTIDISEFTPGVYNERQEIFRDAVFGVGELRKTMATAAAASGIHIDAYSMARWVPSERELGGLQHRFRRERKRLTMVEGIEDYLHDQAEAAAHQGVSLRKHQQVVLSKFHDFLLDMPRSTPEGGKSGIVEMPTGTGKTAIFANIVSALKHNEDPREPVKVLVLVPTQTILNQTVGKGRNRGFGKFAPHLKVDSYYADDKELSKDSEVVVMCNASYINLRKAGKLPAFDAIIVDEAHTAISEGMGDDLRTYAADKIMVGLTATPEYDEERSVYNYFEHRIHQMDLDEAVKAGLLAEVKADLLDVEAYINWHDLPQDPREQKRAIRKARRKAYENAAVGLIKQALARNVGVIVRCQAGDDINQAVKFAERLRDILIPAPNEVYGSRWIEAEPIGGTRQTKTQRFELFTKYDRGDIDVFTYVKGIGVGWDSPHAKVFINLAPTTSKVELIQALGRALRLSFDQNGKSILAEAYDFHDPTLGDRQYTAVKALKLEPGGTLHHDPEDDELPIPPPRPRKPRKRTPEVALTGITVSSLGSLTLKHEVQVTPPTQMEIAQTIAAMRGVTHLNTGDAARVLGVSPPTLRQMLLNVGTNPVQPVELTDLNELINLYPDVKAFPLPDTGYVSAKDVAECLPGHVRTFRLTRFGRLNGMLPQRFIDATGTAGFYYDGEIAAQLIRQFIAEMDK